MPKINRVSRGLHIEVTVARQLPGIVVRNLAGDFLSLRGAEVV